MNRVNSRKLNRVFEPILAVAGLSRREIANRTGLCYNTVCRALNGGGSSPATMVAISNTLGLHDQPLAPWGAENWSTVEGVEHEPVEVTADEH